MQVREIMKSKVDVINADKTVFEAAVMMEQGRYGSIPVEKNDKMVGMITDRDIALRIVAHSRDPQSTKVSDCMSKGIVFCYENDNLETLAEKMTASHLRRVPVVNQDKRLVGIVSLSELVKNARDPKLTQATLESVCH